MWIILEFKLQPVNVMTDNIHKCQSRRFLILKSYSDAYLRAVTFRSNYKKVQTKTVPIVGQQAKFANQK